MEMSKDLYFIPIIERALRGEALDESLRDAFTRIVQIGRESGYRHAYEQFQRFMDEVKSAHALMAGGDEWDRTVGAMAHRFALRIVIEKEGKAFEACVFERISGMCSLKNVMPGEYRIKMETGRIIWEGPITEKDCIWKKAYPGRPLKLAADTGEPDLQPSRTVPLLGGTVLLHFYPGMETGALVIELREASGE